MLTKFIHAANPYIVLTLVDEIRATYITTISRVFTTIAGRAKVAPKQTVEMNATVQTVQTVD